MVCKGTERRHKILMGKRDDKMNVPLLNKEDVEKEGDDIGLSIRDEIIEFLKSKGFTYPPSQEDFGGETNDFFIKDDNDRYQLIKVVIKHRKRGD